MQRRLWTGRETYATVGLLPSFLNPNLNHNLNPQRTTRDDLARHQVRTRGHRDIE